MRRPFILLSLLTMILYLAIFSPTYAKAEASPYVSDVAQAAPMYRLYNPNSGEHFYTARTEEKSYLAGLGWLEEGIGWIAPIHSDVPVYRLYNPNAGDHHYTASAGERDHLVALGWNDEGIGWYSDGEQGSSVFRQYNPNARSGAHNYTVSKGENDYLASIGWNEEGTGWYGLGKKEIAIIPENWIRCSLPTDYLLPGDISSEDIQLELFNQDGEDMIVGSFTNNTRTDISFACFANASWTENQYDNSYGKVLGYQPCLKAGDTFYFAESIADGDGPYICSILIQEPNTLKYEGFSEQLSLSEDGSVTFTVEYDTEQIAVPSTVIVYYDEIGSVAGVEKHICEAPGSYTFSKPSYEYASYRSSCTLGSVQYYKNQHGEYYAAFL